MSEQNPCCAHINVERRRESPNGGMTITREWWECRDCKSEFGPISRLIERVAELDALVDEYGSCIATDQLKIAELTVKLAEISKEAGIQKTAAVAAEAALQEAQKSLNLILNGRGNRRHWTAEYCRTLASMALSTPQSQPPDYCETDDTARLLRQEDTPAVSPVEEGSEK